MNKQVKRILKPASFLAGLCLMGASLTANAQSAPVNPQQNVQLAWYYGGWGHNYGPYWHNYRVRPAYYGRYRGHYYNRGYYRYGGCRNSCRYNWRGEVIRCKRICY